MYIYQLNTTATTTELVLIDTEPIEGDIRIGSQSQSFSFGQIEPVNDDDVMAYFMSVPIQRQNDQPLTAQINLTDGRTFSRLVKFAPASGPVTLAMTSNPNGLRPAKAKLTFQHILKHDVDALLIGGDLGNNGSVQTYLNFLSGQEMTSKVPLICCPGNHDAPTTRRRETRYKWFFGPYWGVQSFGSINIVSIDDTKRWKTIELSMLESVVNQAQGDGLVILATNGGWEKRNADGELRHPGNYEAVLDTLDRVDIILAAGSGMSVISNGDDEAALVRTGGSEYAHHVLTYDPGTRKALIVEYGYIGNERKRLGYGLNREPGEPDPAKPPDPSIPSVPVAMGKVKSVRARGQMWFRDDAGQVNYVYVGGRMGMLTYEEE